jgi:hypothetical protein
MFTARPSLVVAALVALGWPCLAPAAPAAKAIERAPTAAEVAFFEKSIRPVLAGKCYECHSTEAGKSKGGLTLDTRDGIRKGGDSGHAVIPGNVADSLLLTAIRSTDTDVHMPPKETLPANVIADFERWVQMGAPDPRDGKTVTRKLSPEAAAKFWAFQPPKFTPAPKTADTAWPRTEIDKFILAALEAKGLKPVGDADRLTLIRRVYFDLIGLPPKPEEIEAFVADRDPRAFEKVVDRLLASPQFGERWGRHWLDVARYAESTGMERNYLYPEAWRYRDYVIAAFNADKPYNQFIREQVAGDLLPSTSVAQRNERLIATGFLAIGPKGLNERNREQFLLDVIDEQIDATTKAVMALTVSCARCHDHKFDPVTMRDYYAMAGIFRSTQTFYPTGQGQGQNRQPSAPLPLAATPADLVQRPYAPTPPPVYAKKNKKQRQPAAPKAALRDAGAGYAMGVLDGQPQNSPVYARGELEGRGEVVPRGFVQVLSRPGTPGISGTSSGRLELANWLTAPENPLTARAMANRVWLHLFGEGIVRTPDNFGATGEPPTHPELLDHLALRFVANGWSVKNLIRTIVLSRTYQLSGALEAKNFAADPDNRLFWHANQRRLDAEAIRDAMLAIGGQLDLTPPTGPVSTRDMIGAKTGMRTSLSGDSNHRSVYLHIVRDLVPPMLELFDFAEPSLVVAERDVTNVPSQALFMLNNPLVLSLSEQAAQRVLTLKDTAIEARITRAYLMTLSRVPTGAEIARAKDFLCVAATPAQGWSTFCQALFASAEFRYLN